MFSVGEMVVHPLYGAGVVKEIQVKEVLGEKHEYLVLEMAVKNDIVMIPISKVEESGVRELINEDEAEKLLDFLSYPSEIGCDNWNKRYRENADKLKTGEMYEVATVVRELIWRDMSKGLSSRERKMLTSAKKVLLSEISVVMGKSYDDLDVEIKKNIGAIS